ncbi:class I SAM-dependent methyltransferase [Nodosilinea sp. AN01ver1]|uniref:class I SAM-dependent methyltransferase n=1 Tax=Nodosilinea sp. AN01ver1 TaxID=3423362 RepID=UPI003D317B55
MAEMEKESIGWEYKKLGDYHRNLDLNWSYAPTYLQKDSLVRNFLENLGQKKKILDIGCGEGVFVEDFAKNGWNIQGLDLNYESQYVRRGSVLNLPYEDLSLDAVMLLDVFEHLAFKDQMPALSEIYRVLKKDGLFFTSIPNLAHLNSRFSLAFKGALDRTDHELDHPGERPYRENKALLQEAGFKINQCIGVTLTVPFLYRRLICRRAKQLRWLHDLLEPGARVLPSLAMIDFFTCQKTEP